MTESLLVQFINHSYDAHIARYDKILAKYRVRVEGEKE